MRVACSEYEGAQKCIQICASEIYRNKNHVVGRRKWENDIEIIRWQGLDWIYLARVKDRWQIFVSTVMNLRVLKKIRISSVAEQLSASHNGGCSTHMNKSRTIHKCVYSVLALNTC
jgi:hypothetical protein